jgi:hypothetical protein
LFSVLHFAFVVFVFWATFHALFIDHKPRRSPVAYRRERRHRQAEKAAKRYERIPPIVRVINEEKRWRKARRSAVAAVRWALVAKDFDRDEIAGAVVLAVRRDREVVFDHDRLYENCLQILKRATLEEGS